VNPVGILQKKTFGMEKLEWLGYLMVKKNDVFIRFDIIQECDGQTDRQTDTAWTA